jgi:hypothetical protein
MVSIDVSDVRFSSCISRRPLPSVDAAAQLNRLA